MVIAVVGAEGIVARAIGIGAAGSRSSSSSRSRSSRSRGPVGSRNGKIGWSL